MKLLSQLDEDMAYEMGFLLQAKPEFFVHSLRQKLSGAQLIYNWR